jgi:hypothetical protein
LKEDFIAVAYVISNILAVIMLGCSWKYSNLARVLYSALFGWACYLNISTALSTPEYYLEYSQVALLDFYVSFINGYFAGHIAAIVIAIAVYQLAIAISMWFKGWIFKTGCIGAIIFLIAIAPLGIGSAFPCTLIMAAGLLLLLRRGNTGFLIQELWFRPRAEESSELM